MASKAVVPLIVITGPTASGKSSLAIELAEAYDGEIICADSRTVYQGFDIGTAKPSQDDRRRVRHWLLDVAGPNDYYTVADFQREARTAIDDIRSRGKIPFMVGGTGLYIDAVVCNFEFSGASPDVTLRNKLEQLDIVELQEMIKRQHLLMPENYKNKRYLIRCIEKNNKNHISSTVDPTAIVIALHVERDELRKRIHQRITMMIDDGVMQETQRQRVTYEINHPALSGNIYRLMSQVLDGEMSLDDAKEKAATLDLQLAKRQTTWLKRHDFVQWMSPDDTKRCLQKILTEYRNGLS
jgi:tRNA dimethylallyltransferase